MGTKRVALVKLAQRYVDPALYQILQEIRDKINELIDERVTGAGVLINGAATIRTGFVKVDSVIHIDIVTPIGTPGVRWETPPTERVPGTGFVVRSTSLLDNSTFTWEVVND
jgi:hypothetical protein